MDRGSSNPKCKRYEANLDTLTEHAVNGEQLDPTLREFAISWLRRPRTSTVRLRVTEEQLIR
jgi:hypothetical protein